jgi:hypothetical protein
MSKPVTVEHQETDIKTSQVLHADDKHYVINTASFHDPFQHHQVSRTNLPQISDQDMAQCVLDGLRNWDVHNFVFDQTNKEEEENIEGTAI